MFNNALKIKNSFDYSGINDEFIANQKILTNEWFEDVSLDTFLRDNSGNELGSLTLYNTIHNIRINGRVGKAIIFKNFKNVKGDNNDKIIEISGVGLFRNIDNNRLNKDTILGIKNKNYLIKNNLQYTDFSVVNEFNILKYYDNNEIDFVRYRDNNMNIDNKSIYEPSGFIEVLGRFIIPNLYTNSIVFRNSPWLEANKEVFNNIPSSYYRAVKSNDRSVFIVNQKPSKMDEDEIYNTFIPTKYDSDNYKLKFKLNDFNIVTHEHDYDYQTKLDMSFHQLKIYDQDVSFTENSNSYNLLYESPIKDSSLSLEFLNYKEFYFKNINKESN